MIIPGGEIRFFVVTLTYGCAAVSVPDGPEGPSHCVGEIFGPFDSEDEARRVQNQIPPGLWPHLITQATRKVQ